MVLGVSGGESAGVAQEDDADDDIGNPNLKKHATLLTTTIPNNSQQHC